MVIFRRSRSVSIFGIRAVGKTAYLVMLINQLSKMVNIKDMHFHSGFDYYMKMMSWILKGDGPQPTKPADRILIHIKMKVDGKAIEIRTLDVAGGDIEKMGEVFKALIEGGDGYIFLVEPTQEPERRVTQVWLIYKLIEYLTQGFKTRVNKPLAIAFTKNDIYGIKEPQKFFVEYTKPVYNLEQVLARIKKHEFFAISSYGGDLEELKMEGKSPTPVDVEKPFLWITENS